SLEQSLVCFRQLGTESELDSLLDEALANHEKAPEVYAAAAKVLLQASPFGVIVDGEFLRGNNSRRRVGGTFLNCAEQDRARALQWLEKALALVTPKAAQQRGEVRLQLADTLLNQRNDAFAWRLQSLTDLTEALSYTDQGQQTSFSTSSAPVDREGKPLLYALPDTFGASKSDGERLRWALSADGMPKSLADDATLRWARFLESQFSVRTLSQFSWMRYSGEPTDEQANDSILSLHTLSDSEMAAKLANGVKRFTLPNEHHFIHQYEQLLGTQVATKLPAATALVEIYLNRRQFEKAAALIRQNSDLKELQRRLSDIVDARITFDPLKPQPSGAPVELSYVFRNADRLEFEAQQVDLERLIQEVQNHFTNLTSNNRFFQGKQGSSVPNLVYPQNLFREEKILDYTTGVKQSWDEEVQPRANHWDKRQKTRTPLSKPGLYVVHVNATSSASQTNHAARILVWVSENTILQKPLPNQQLFSVVQSGNGQPLQTGMLEFFGWRWDSKRQGTITKRMAVNLDEAGEVIQKLDQGFQWLTILRVPNSSPTLLNFRSFYSRGVQKASYRRGKAYGVCSQPIYRPGNQAKIKFWCAYTTYGELDPPRIANTKLEARVLDPQGNEVFKETVTTNEFGSFEIEPKLTKAS
ncbi:MAG: hypothetical protein AAGG44_20065, partial [Planctomycetota bacterium]